MILARKYFKTIPIFIFCVASGMNCVLGKQSFFNCSPRTQKTIQIHPIKYIFGGFGNSSSFIMGWFFGSGFSGVLGILEVGLLKWAMTQMNSQDPVENRGETGF